MLFFFREKRGRLSAPFQRKVAIKEEGRKRSTDPRRTKRQDAKEKSDQCRHKIFLLYFLWFRKTEREEGLRCALFRPTCNFFFFFLSIHWSSSLSFLFKIKERRALGAEPRVAWTGQRFHLSPFVALWQRARETAWSPKNCLLPTRQTESSKETSPTTKAGPPRSRPLFMRAAPQKRT